MGLKFDNIVLVKPEDYEKLNKTAIEGYFKAEQRVFPLIEKLIAMGEKQLKAKTNYTSEKLPGESPKRTPEFSLDEIKFSLVTDVQVINPPYQTVFDKITGFLEVLVNDWKQGVRKDGVRTYDAEIIIDCRKTCQKAPFVRWDYLMWSELWYQSRATELGVTNEIEKIEAPAELDLMSREKLVIPLDLIKNFNIERPGAAKIWYLTRKFYDDINAATVVPVEEEMIKRSGITKEEALDETKKYFEQIENYLPSVESIPSPRRQPGQVINLLYKIPQKGKPKGSTALPIVPTHENYLKLLEDYKPLLLTSLKKWKKLEGNIGELVTFYYNIENDEKVQKQFPFLQEYQLKRDGDKMFIYIQALYNGMKELEKDYKTNRLLRKHSIKFII